MNERRCWGIKFSDEVGAYLEGISFSSGIKVNTASRNDPDTDRISLLEGICTGKNVIHLGCADHLPLIKSKIENDTWLHGRLCRCSNACLGVDINKEGVEFLRNSLGYTDVICSNMIEDDNPLIMANHWDYVVMGEVLEHLNNPQHFLKVFRDKYEGCVERIVITVPNAISWQNFKFAFANSEFINTDHRYWFTSFTLAKMAIISGMRIEDFWFCRSFPDRSSRLSSVAHPLKVLDNLIYWLFPAMRSTLLMVVRL